MGLAFFGLTFDTVAQARAAIFTQIHEIVFHGKGGYDWDTVYNMPIWLRKTTFNMIKEHYDKEAEEYEKHNNMMKNKGKSEIARPNITPTPTYTAKAPKK